MPTKGATSITESTHGLIQMSNSCHSETVMAKGPSPIKLCLKSMIKSHMESARPRTVKIRCFIMEENVFTIGSADPGFVTRRQVYAKGDLRASPALITSNATKVWPADLTFIGLLSLNVSQWLMWAPTAQLSSTASPETSAGRLIRIDLASAWRSTLLLMTSNSTGIKIAIQLKQLLLFSNMACIASLESPSKILLPIQQGIQLPVLPFLKFSQHLKQVLKSQISTQMSHTLTLATPMAAPFASIIRELRGNLNLSASVGLSKGTHRKVIAHSQKKA